MSKWEGGCELDTGTEAENNRAILHESSDLVFHTLSVIDHLSLYYFLVPRASGIDRLNYPHFAPPSPGLKRLWYWRRKGY